MARTVEFTDDLSLEALVDRLSLALDGAGLGIWDWDPRDNRVQFDRRWCEMLGLDYATTPMQLSTWESRVHPDDLPGCYEDITAHVTGLTEYYENVHRMRHANGGWVYILDRGRISQRDAKGRPTRFTGTHLDVTHTERAKRTLADQDRQLRALVRNLPVPMAMLDRDTRYLAASERWLTRRGVVEADILGRRDSEVFPSTGKDWSEVYARCLRGETLSAREERFSRRDGSTGWLRWTVCPWHEFDGRIGGLIVVSEDVSAEVEQRAMRDQESRLAALGLMAGGVGHEINTPLQIVLLEAEEVEVELDRATPNLAAVREGLTTIGATTRRIAGIVAAMRSLSEDAAARPIGAVSVVEVVESARALSGGRLAAAGVRLETVGVEAAPPVRGRHVEMVQVLLNLLGNACDAAAEASDKWIRLVAEREADMLVFRCIDSGAGVLPEHRARLMLPFFTTKPVGRGTGLGLSVCRALAVRLGGWLRFEPDMPHTTFAFAVPIALADAESAL